MAEYVQFMSTSLCVSFFEVELCRRLVAEDAASKVAAGTFKKIYTCFLPR